MLASCGKVIKDSKKLVRHRRRTQVSAAEAERLDTVSDDGCAFGRPVADAVVLHEHRPAPITSVAQPVDVRYLLVSGNSVDLRESVQPNSGRSEEVRNLAPPETAVKKQNRQSRRVPCPHLRRQEARRCARRPPAARVAPRTPRQPRRAVRQRGTSRWRPRLELHRERRSAGQIRGWDRRPPRPPRTPVAASAGRIRRHRRRLDASTTR